MTTKRITVEKVVLIRALHDIAPKLVAAAIGGLSATSLVALASIIHVHLTTPEAALFATLLAVLAGYVKADTPLLTGLDRAYELTKADPANTRLDAVVTDVAKAVDTLAPVAAVAVPEVGPYVKPVLDSVDTVKNLLGVGGSDATEHPTVVQG